MKKLSTYLLSSIVALSSYAKHVDMSNKGPGNNNQIAAGCTPATTATDLDINNIKILVQTGGDMWWDLQGSPRFEVPKGSDRHSMFAGALWLGGKDVSGQLKVAAQRYRQVGLDYWTGPLSTVNFEIDAATCAAYDRHFSTTRSEVENYKKYYDAKISDAENGTTIIQDEFADYSRPTIIDEWPAHGRNYDPYNEDFYLAPFYDRNGDGIYNPGDGDYPGYELDTESECGDRRTNVYGDANLWWVFNDKGNVHTESGSNSIGMEVRAQAFSFATTDEVNNMTFCNYELVNRSSFTLTETYFGVFCDADLGGANDDFVGCDVMRGLGYCYNGDNDDKDDQGSKGYGTTPPAIGVDFFEGPYQDSDGIDNAVGIGEGEALNGIGYGDGVVDNERFGMRRFVFFNNGGGGCCSDPETGTEYYNYLRSFWKDGTRMVFGGTGHQNTGGTVNSDFMFPGDTDPLNWGTGGIDPGYPDPSGWTEDAEGNTPADRRFIQSAGPFTLLPGAVNDITVGVVWAQSSTGGAQGSVEAMIRADTKTQALFDSCFRLKSGPDAPVLLTQELDKEIILYITNPKVSNNYQEGYAEKDAFIIPVDSMDTDGDGINDYELTQEDKDEYQTYRFEGYKVYQVKDASVDVSSLDDIDQARLIYQGDIRNGVSKVYNYVKDEETGYIVVEEMADGSDEGIQHSLQVKEDLFASGDRKLINHKTYYFIAIAYAYNNHTNFDEDNPSSQDEQYLESRKSPTGGISVVSAIPHIPAPEAGGTVANSSYGDAVPVTRIEGQGNSGLFLEMTSTSKDSIMMGSPWKVSNPEYEVGGTPVVIKVVDPLNVVGGEFSVQFMDSTNNGTLSDAYYRVYRRDADADTIYSSRDIEIGSEELILDWGISIFTEQAPLPGVEDDGSYGFIDAAIEYADDSKAWLSGIPDVNGDSLFDWIRIGAAEADLGDWYNYDNYTPYNQILDGTWAPARICSNLEWGPFPNNITKTSNPVFLPLTMDAIMGNLSQLKSVDIVFTDDKTKWTRCPVIEMGWVPQDNKGEIGYGPFITSGGNEIAGAMKGRLRQSPSVDKDGNAAAWPASDVSSADENDPNFISAYGMGWFPGYAIDIESGERLNMAFGENSNSLFEAENGSDMKWNPTDRVTDDGPVQGIRLGGEHYIYVFRNNTDRQNDPPVKIIGVDRVFFDEQTKRMPAYDYGEFAVSHLKDSDPAASAQDFDYALAEVYGACMWVGLPILQPEADLLATEATLKLRVRRPFERYGTGAFVDSDTTLTENQGYWVYEGPISHTHRVDSVMTTDTLYHGDAFVFDTSSTVSPLTINTNNALVLVENGGLPLYNFSTIGMETVTENDSTATSVLDLINIVPNPYYAYSQYEENRLDNRVKIVNLPDQCEINIYTVNGTLVRTFSKDDPTQTYIDWDLKNYAFIPIASGVYLIHVEVPGVGETVLKWFGALRPTDLDSF